LFVRLFVCFCHREIQAARRPSKKLIRRFRCKCQERSWIDLICANNFLFQIHLFAFFSTKDEPDDRFLPSWRSTWCADSDDCSWMMWQISANEIQKLLLPFATQRRKE